MSSIYFTMAVRDLVQTHRPLPPSRECEVCPKTAWLVDEKTLDGRRVQSFICPNGHLKIVQEIA